MINKKVYWLVLLFCFMAYTWLAYNFFYLDEHDEFTVCFIKNVTGVPCPSCGITRSVLQILHGNFSNAIFINPLGMFAGIVLLLTPVWITADFYLKKESLINVIKSAEIIIKSRAVYLPLIFLCLLNWYWNIMKGL